MDSQRFIKLSGSPTPTEYSVHNLDDSLEDSRRPSFSGEEYQQRVRYPEVLQEGRDITISTRGLFLSTCYLCGQKFFSQTLDQSVCQTWSCFSRSRGFGSIQFSKKQMDTIKAGFYFQTSDVKITVKERVKKPQKVCEKVELIPIVELFEVTGTSLVQPDGPASTELNGTASLQLLGPQGEMSSSSAAMGPGEPTPTVASSVAVAVLMDADSENPEPSSGYSLNQQVDSGARNSEDKEVHSNSTSLEESDLPTTRVSGSEAGSSARSSSTKTNSSSNQAHTNEIGDVRLQISYEENPNLKKINSFEDDDDSISDQ